MKFDLENKKWKAFVLGELFKLIRGKRFITIDRQKGNIPYYSASSSNNGLTDFIGNPLFQTSNKIIVTTFCDAYYVTGNFTASDEITMMTNSHINEYSGRFIANIITSNQNKYAFGRKAFSDRLAKQIILLPVDIDEDPDYKFMESFIRQKEQEKLNQYAKYIKKRFSEIEGYKEVEPIETKEFSEFEINDIFLIKSGVRLTKADINDGNKPFIGATDSNNGITEFVSNTNNSEDSNVLGVNYNGSVVENFYHPYKAIFSDDVKRLSFKNAEDNKYLFLFVKTQILQQKEKYQYGYKFNAKRMKKQRIMLPVNKKGNPDYAYMENFMKNLEYKKLQKYLTTKGM